MGKIAAAGGKAVSKTFEARLKGEGPNGAWTFIDVPFDVGKTWGTRARVSVVACINGESYRTSIFPAGDGTHRMMVNKRMQAAARAGAGDVVSVTMSPDVGERTVEVPRDLRGALAADKQAKGLFKALSYSCKKEYVEWITSAKREETRAGRVTKAVEMLRAGRKRVKD